MLTMPASHDTLPDEIAQLTQPLFEALPLEQAMQQLVVQQMLSQH